MKSPVLSVLALTLIAGSAHASVNLTFQNGVNGYAGTQDTELRSSPADTGTPQGGFESISVDGDDGSPDRKPNHGLVRFDSVFGAAAGQINAGDTIINATLTLNVFNPGSGFSVYDMLVDWNEATATWDSLANGIQGNGVEASNIAFAVFGADTSGENVPTGALVIDVTASLQKVQAGLLPGHGWGLVPFVNGTNGIDFETSEAFMASARPMLSVEVAPVPEPETYALMLAGLGLVGFAARRVRA
ncbi:MAG: PEP-CTERM sorting domain-containing protein [Thiobacillus sp.]|nr:PEP-CTERM sorting domain-containing protein [Thiobacillus sp.]